MNTVVRTRFAPSPSGFLHLGNLRSALFSFLAARESHGVFILRIEDTDTTRTSDEYLNAIYYYLTWMGLLWDEGPHKGGSCGSYKQSERHEIYENYLKKCIDLGCVYRCFKTTEELDMERAKQIACGLPPRYVRVINDQKEQQYLQEGKPFVWRFALPQGTISIIDKVRGKSTFDLSNFADAPITRQDGTFTFLFANFVDDIEMNITYVVRGEEHISNTAVQACMYEALKIQQPLYYHLPLLCDKQGKKLSKRDFGFSLQDLINGGFLPHAIINYLIIIGSSFEQEIFSLDEAIAMKCFEKTHSTGSIRYDLDKLVWINKQWMKKINPSELRKIIAPLVKEKYGTKADALLHNDAFITDLKEECENFNQCVEYINFFISDMRYTDVPSYVIDILNTWIARQKSFDFLKQAVADYAKHTGTHQKEIWQNIRYYFTGMREGLSVALITKYT
jgi:glutamyl-tRNA synthetase